MERAQKGVAIPAIGRSRGGITTKIHAIVDALGNPIRFELTAGNCHDCVKGYEMLQDMDLTRKTVIADRGYDMNRIFGTDREAARTAVIPSPETSKNSTNVRLVALQRAPPGWMFIQQT